MNNSFKSNQQVYSFNQKHHRVVVPGGGQCGKGIGKEGSGRHGGGENDGRGDLNGKLPRKGSVLWTVAKTKLFPGRRNKKLVNCQQHGIEPNSTGSTTPPAVVHIDTWTDTSPEQHRNAYKLPQQLDSSSKRSSSSSCYIDQRATIERLQSDLERERKVVHEYHDDWEETQIEAVRLKEYVGFLKDHTRKLKSEIVRITQDHTIKHFRQVPLPIPELPFLCPVDNQLYEDYQRVGKYDRGNLLGKGQFGLVWEAWLHSPSCSTGAPNGDDKPHFATSRRKRHNKERVFAIKEIDKSRFNSYRMLTALNREVQALQLCYHPNIVHLVEVFHGPKAFYLVFEKAWMDAHTLIRSFSTFPLVTIRHIMKAVFRALQHIHAKGVAHLDVKPENILIVHPGQRCDDRHAAGFIKSEHVRLCDFGLCVIDKNRQQQQEQQQRRLVSPSHHNHPQPYRHNYNDDMPEFNIGDNSVTSHGGIPTASHCPATDQHHELGDRINDATAPSSLIEQGNVVLGTPGFYAPEMTERESFDAIAADMWSAGACLMEFTIGLKDFWWNTYERYGQLRRRRHRHRGSLRRGAGQHPPDSSDGVQLQSPLLAAHPYAPVTQSTASKKSTFELGTELYWYLETMEEMEWSDKYLKDLILNKLMVEPERRWTASQALGHPWMALKKSR